jgi:hypothetical protein
MKEYPMKFLTIFIDAIMVFLIAKISFDFFAGRDGMFLLDAAPAGVVLIYGIGYFAVLNINRQVAALYRTLVGVFVVVSMMIHSTTINFMLDGEAVWKTISLIIASATLFSTQFITKVIAEYAE